MIESLAGALAKSELLGQSTQSSWGPAGAEYELTPLLLPTSLPNSHMAVFSATPRQVSIVMPRRIPGV